MSKSIRRRVLALAGTTVLSLSLANGIGIGAAHADEIRNPAPAPTHQDGEVCNWSNCWLVHLACWASGQDSEEISDSVGNTAVVCHEKKATGTTAP